jgi:enamine deaminase RidA (YjgF/YER057c/UK114 family)
MSEIHRIAAGKRLSEAVIHDGRVYLCGVVAEEAAGQSIAAQTQDVLSQIDAMLADAGSDKSRLLTCTIWLRDISTIDAMNAVWDRWVIPGQTPARATVEARLADPNWSIEIMATAALLTKGTH